MQWLESSFLFKAYLTGSRSIPTNRLYIQMQLQGKAVFASSSTLGPQNEQLICDLDLIVGGHKFI